MARVDLPQSRLRARRRRRRWIIGSAAVFLLALLVAGASWLSHAAFLRITTIEVTGAKTLATSSLEAYAKGQLEGDYLWLFARDNIFLYPRGYIEQSLAAQYPTLRQVDVHAKDFHTVEIAVAERTPAALWCPSTGSGCQFLDEEGLAYAQAPQFSDAPYITYQGALGSSTEPGLRQYLEPGQFQTLSALVIALAQKEPGNPVRLVAVDANGAVRAYFQNDFLLIFNLQDDGGEVFERFNLALQSSDFAGHALSDFEYLDLRYGDKLYYKLK